ncbi:MAG TPA: hypothetical protein PLZ98_08765, partial [Chitinophagaceae bacterium]|nr:hypothetical protein [Chitinophagaceae bacterium]
LSKRNRLITNNFRGTLPAPLIEAVSFFFGLGRWVAKKIQAESRLRRHCGELLGYKTLGI